jgi:glycosyltransferase involved in cell wall biosynthesis
MRIFFVDQDLTGCAGHCLNYALVFSAAVRNCGRDVTIIANRQFDPGLAPDFKVFRAFTFPLPDPSAGTASLLPGAALPAIAHKMLRLACNVLPRRTWRRRARALLNFARETDVLCADWMRIDQEFAFTAADLIVLNTLNSRHLHAYVRWISGRRRESRPLCVAILHVWPGLRSQEDHAILDRARWKRAFKEMLKCDLADRMFFVTTSAEMAAEFRQLSSCPIATITYPHFLNLPGRKRPPEHSPRAILFLGVGALYKGFPLLPGIVQALRPEFDSGVVQFLFQANVVGPDKELADAMSALERLPIQMVRGELRPEQYSALLESADILLQPGDPTYYSKQISGVFTDARAAGLVAVVPAGTLMAREIISSGGGVVVAEHSVDAYARGLRQAIDEFEQLAVEARTVGPAWKCEHSPTILIRQIDGLLPEDHRIAHTWPQGALTETASRGNAC